MRHVFSSLMLIGTLFVALLKGSKFWKISK